MKICLINNLYKPFNRGGAEKVAALIAEGLKQSGHEVFIITTKPRRAKTPSAQPKVYYLNGFYHSLNKTPKFLRFFWHVWDMLNIINYFKVKKILKKEKARAVITNNLMGLGFLIPLAIKSLKIKNLHIVHDIQLIYPSGLLLFGKEKILNSYLARNYAGLMNFIMGSPQAVIFPSSWLLRLHLDKIFFIKSKRIVLPNPAGAVNWPEKKFEEGIFKFLYLGQIENHKGLSLLISAFKKAKEKHRGIELIIAGSGSMLSRLKEEEKDNHGIKFLGWQSEPEIKNLLRSCQALVAPTICYENCPVVIQDAFSAELPVIAADLGGISELIGEKAGILFRPANAADLSDKMIWAMENDLSEIKKAAKEKAANFRLDNYIKKIEELI